MSSMSQKVSPDAHHRIVMGPMVCGPGHVPPVGRCVIRLGTRAGHPRVKSPFSGRDFSARRSLSDHGKRGDSHRNRTSAFVFIDNLMPLKGSNHQNRIRTSPAFSYIWADFGFSVSTMSGLVVDLGTSSILAERRPPPNANSRRSATFCLPYTAINRRILPTEVWWQQSGKAPSPHCRVLQIA